MMLVTAMSKRSCEYCVTVGLVMRTGGIAYVKMLAVNGASCLPTVNGMLL